MHLFRILNILVVFVISFVSHNILHSPSGFISLLFLYCCALIYFLSPRNYIGGFNNTYEEPIVQINGQTYRN